MGTHTVAVQTIHDTGRAQIVLHPLRLEILSELAEPVSAAGLARRLGLPRQKLNYHLRQLESEGLVEQVGEQRKRNCTERLMRAAAQSYVISPAVLGRVAADPEQIRDKASSAYLMAVAARIVQEVGDLRAKADDADKRLPTLTLESEVRFASPAHQHAFAQELAEAIAAVVRKYHDEYAPEGRRFRFITGAYPTPASDESTENGEEQNEKENT